MKVSHACAPEATTLQHCASMAPGMESTPSNDSDDFHGPADLAAFITQTTGSTDDPLSALDECLDELTAIAPLAYPARVSIQPADEAAIRRCVAAVPHSKTLSDVVIEAYEDGSHSISYEYDQTALTAPEGVARDRAILGCLPEHP